MRKAVSLCFILFLVAVLSIPILDGDVFFYLSLGRILFQGSWIPDQDPFLYTIKDWNIYHQWLSFLIFYLFYALSGLWGIYVLRFVLWIGLFGLLAKVAQRWKLQEGVIFLFFIPVVVACSYRFIDRGSLISDFILLGLTAIFLNDGSLSKRKLVLLPLLFMFWVNIHAAFVIGLALFTAYAISLGKHGTRPLWISVVVSYVATLINPTFLKGAIFPLYTAFKPEWATYRKINFEWMPTFKAPFVYAHEVHALIALLVLAAILVLWSFSKKNIFIIFAFLIYAYLAQDSARFMSTSALGLALVSFYNLKEKGFQIGKKTNQILSIFLCVSFIFSSIYVLTRGYPSSMGYRHLSFGIDEQSFPVKAVDFIKDKGLTGRLFNQYEWGSYLIWRLDQRDNLFIHTHVDDPGFLDKGYYGVGRSFEEFQETVVRYDVKYFLLDSVAFRMQPTPKILAFLDSWKIIYQDNTATLWERP